MKARSPSFGQPLSIPSKRNSPAAAERWSRSNPAAPALSAEKGRKSLSSYFLDSTLGALLDRLLACSNRSLKIENKTQKTYEHPARCSVSFRRPTVFPLSLQRRVTCVSELLQQFVHDLV